MDNFLNEVRVHGITVVVFITLDWIFVLMNKSTMVPCRCVLERKLAVSALPIAALYRIPIDSSKQTRFFVVKVIR